MDEIMFGRSDSCERLAGLMKAQAKALKGVLAHLLLWQPARPHADACRNLEPLLAGCHARCKTFMLITFQARGHVPFLHTALFSWATTAHQTLLAHGACWDGQMQRARCCCRELRHGRAGSLPGRRGAGCNGAPGRSPRPLHRPARCAHVHALPRQGHPSGAMPFCRSRRLHTYRDCLCRHAAMGAEQSRQAQPCRPLRLVHACRCWLQGILEPGPGWR